MNKTFDFGIEIKSSCYGRISESRLEFAEIIESARKQRQLARAYLRMLECVN